MVDRDVLPLCLGRKVDPEVGGGRQEVLPPCLGREVGPEVDGRPRSATSLFRTGS